MQIQDIEEKESECKINYLKAIRPSGTGFEYCINPYDGCTHGCKYCYGRIRRLRKYEGWIRSKPNLKIVGRLEKDVLKIREKRIKDKIRDIFIGSICDCYQPLELEHRLTQQIIRILTENELPFTILTKNDNVLRDTDILKDYDKCRAGFTVITLNEEYKLKLEPYSPSIQKRIDALKALNANGVSTYCSIEPIMPMNESDPFEIVDKLKPYVDIFEFGKWSPCIIKGGMEIEAENLKKNPNFYRELFSRLIPYCEDRDIRYCIASHSGKLLFDSNIPFIPYQLVTDRPYPAKASEVIG